MIPRFVNHRQGNSLVYLCNLVITLSSHKYDGYLLDISKLGHLGIVIVDGVEGGLVLETEDEDHSVHPSSKLKEKKLNTINLQCLRCFTWSSGGPPSSLISRR